MEAIEYIKLANSHKSGQHKDKPVFKVRVISNFTDDILAKLLTGKIMSEGLEPEILQTPYRQYHLQLKDKNSGLYKNPADLVFVFFDLNTYNAGEFSSEEKFTEVIADIKNFVESQNGVVVINSFILPYHSAYGNSTADNNLFNLAQKYNQQLYKLSGEIKNFYVFDANRLVHRLGEKQTRDLRSLYAFDLPFTMEFFKELVEEWFAYVAALTGRAKKVLVLDLDNTLWGGIVGEAGPNGIALGPDYPGLAFVNFQRAVLEFYRRGILLAVNSRNNQADVDEVFAKNPHMVLKPEHFAASRVNWNNKADNLVEIAKELNLGLDSLVFLDDDPANRELVRSALPEVLVPDFTLPPEDYASALFSLPVFSPFPLTKEDKEKGKMYEQESERKKVLAGSADLQDYIKNLGITMKTSINDPATVARVSQMTLKTNQFNLTTKRYSEKDIETFMKQGLVACADVSDKFGNYGITVLAIISPIKKSEAVLDNFLMSCRVMGRGVEQDFFNFLLGELKNRGINKLSASFIPTPKNDPAKDFLPSLGFEPTGDNDYVLNVVKK